VSGLTDTLAADAPRAVGRDQHGPGLPCEPGHGHGPEPHPIILKANHGAGGTGEPIAMILRKGNAASNTAVDHIEVAKAALAQLPSTSRDGGLGGRC
jgi:hypothetical protein